MNTDSFTSGSQPAPSGPEEAIAERWGKLLKHPFFQTKADLPPSRPRLRALMGKLAETEAAWIEEQAYAKRWENTTPQGREIIRKTLWELKRQLKAQSGMPGPSASGPLPEDPKNTMTHETGPANG